MSVVLRLWRIPRTAAGTIPRATSAKASCGHSEPSQREHQAARQESIAFILVNRRLVGQKDLLDLTLKSTPEWTIGSGVDVSGHQAARIGVVAEATGLTVDAIRYYERLGLIAKPARTEGGFRKYPPDTIARVRFIKQAQRLGLELKEIRQLLASAQGRDREQCRHMRTLLARHLADVEARMRELDAFRDLLQAALAQCDRALRMKETIACPVIRGLQRDER
jgi:MerR family mercuric resistance operon transcriptional regulator